MDRDGERALSHAQRGETQPVVRKLLELGVRHAAAGGAELSGAEQQRQGCTPQPSLMGCRIWKIVYINNFRDLPEKIQEIAQKAGIEVTGPNQAL